MSLVSPACLGKVKGGKFVADDPKQFRSAFYSHEGRRVKVQVSRYRENRTDPQNRYYFGVVVKMIGDAIGEDDLEVVHDMLKAEFNYEIVVVGKNREMKKPLSTAELDTTQFSEYVERIKRWASEFLSLYIPDPREV